MKNFFYLFFKSFKDVVPLITLFLFFQLVVLDEPFPNPGRLAVGVFLVVFGLFLFMRGLEAGLFPLGESMAHSFAARGNIWWLLFFAAAIGYSATIAEPSLMAIAIKAESITNGSITSFSLRNAVAIGVALGIALGAFRIILGHPIHYYFIGGYIIVSIITIFAPKEIIGLAYDSGGVTTSSITVPLVTALGIGLARSIDGRNPLMDGFGLIAFASLAPIITVMGYGLIVL
ncbi:hypothetical protein MNBD_NITROSPINAE02-908 [hydrothermal vent metagenome]|uniref:Permease of the major facilitator superfamily n=1 Tax=hydrothermal vent metagenome TaxID=652676 RepID=A0A3B1BXQ6_9ZZZZ